MIEKPELRSDRLRRGNARYSLRPDPVENDEEFESKHPRDDSGKFGKGNKSDKSKQTKSDPKAAISDFLNVTTKDKDELQKYARSKPKAFDESRDSGEEMRRLMDEKYGKGSWSENQMWEDAMYGALGERAEKIADKYADIGPANMAFFRSGLYGREEPKPVIGWRFGDMPESGRSWDASGEKKEPGISVVGTSDEENRKGVAETYKMFVGDRPLVKIVGYKLHGKGADGEPLMVYAKEIGRTALNNSIRIYRAPR